MRLPAALIFACLTAFSQQTQPPLPEGVYRAGQNGVTAPQVASKVDPQLPEEASLAKLSGTVNITLVVDESGEPRNVQALTSPGLGSDEAAIAAVSKWRFKPGEKDGMPVPVSVNVEARSFRLLQSRAWAPYPRDFRFPGRHSQTGSNRGSVSAHVLADGETGSVALSFDIDPTGRSNESPHHKILQHGGGKRSNPHRARMAIPASHQRRPACLRSMQHGIFERKPSLTRSRASLPLNFFTGSRVITAVNNLALAATAIAALAVSIGGSGSR